MKKSILSPSLSSRLKNRSGYRGNSKNCRHSPSTIYHLPFTNYGFTIVELLVVIVVIGILAAITIVSYTGISGKATVASVQSDLVSAKKQLALYYVDHGVYPASIDPTTKCPLDNSTPTPIADTRYCLKPSTGNSFFYSPSSLTYSTFILDSINTASSTKYRVTNDSAPVSAMPTDTITIGTQTWMKYNVDEGTMVTGGTDQINNSVVEKYCYGNIADNCTIFGGLYQWAEAVQYQNNASNIASPNPVFSTNVQGICPAGFHIPTDTEYKTLEMQLGMLSPSETDATGWRGTHLEGTQLKLGGTSGLNVPRAGYRDTGGTFGNLSSAAYLWSSSESSATYAWIRYLTSGHAAVYRDTDDKGYGFSVRCLGN